MLILKSDIIYNPYSVQPLCLPYKANNQPNYWDGKTGVITGYAHQDDTAAYLANTQMTTFSTAKCNQVLDDEVEDIKECKFSLFLSNMSTSIANKGKSSKSARTPRRLTCQVQLCAK